MKKVQILIIVAILSLISCSTEDTNSTGENPTGETPTGENPAGENPEAADCNISAVTYGFYSGSKVYTTTYTGENLTELTSDEDRVVLTYDSQNNLTKKEVYQLGNSQVQFKSQFASNSIGFENLKVYLFQP